MSTTVTYKGETLTTVNNATKTLETKGTWLEDDLTLVDVSGGGSTLITKSISANGTYNASSDSADGYSQVTVAVPNSYSAGDEGKVVDSGALVAQTAHADVTPTTSDQTIDTTTNNSIKVKGDANLVAGNIKKDVTIFGTTGSYEGGGGGSSAISLLDTITVPANTRAVNIDLTDYQNYNFLMVYGNIELTESDWLYLAKDGSSPSGGLYSHSMTNHDGVLAVQFNMLSGCTSITSGVRSKNSLNSINGQMTNLYIYTYTSSKYIKAGSVIKVYGGNYADM